VYSAPVIHWRSAGTGARSWRPAAAALLVGLAAALTGAAFALSRGLTREYGRTARLPAMFDDALALGAVVAGLLLLAAVTAGVRSALVLTVVTLAGVTLGLIAPVAGTALGERDHARNVAQVVTSQDAPAPHRSTVRVTNRPG
jgi:hypothetical protein